MTGGGTFQTVEMLPLFPTFVWKADLKPDQFQPLNQQILAALTSLGAPLNALRPGENWQSDHGLHHNPAFHILTGWIQQAAALVVDDLGTEYLDGKGFFLANFDALVNHRYSHRLPTVITTNLKVDEFRKYGVRVVDRIREVGVFLSVNAPSMRRRS